MEYTIIGQIDFTKVVRPPENLEKDLTEAIVKEFPGVVEQALKDILDHLFDSHEVSHVQVFMQKENCDACKIDIPEPKA